MGTTSAPCRGCSSYAFRLPLSPSSGTGWKCRKCNQVPIPGWSALANRAARAFLPKMEDTMRAVIVLLALAGCVDPTDPASGCPTMISEAGRQWQAECGRARMEAEARAEGKAVTTCVQSPSGMTCVTE